jgi:ubiquitin carboxyl-terminal hydrolase 7
MRLAAKYAEERAAAERRKKERDEAHLYMDIFVATDDNFRHYQGFDIVPFAKSDLIDDKAYPKPHRVKKKALLSEFVAQVAEDIGVDAQFLRPWSMVGRQNGTIRPDSAISTDTDITVEECYAKYQHKGTLRLWMEQCEKDESGKPIIVINNPELQGKEKQILLFVKFFDVDKQTLYGVGHFYAGHHDKVSDLSPQILKLLNWPPGTNYRIFEVSWIFDSSNKC